MPRVLVLHQILLTLSEDLEDQGRYIRFVLELLHWCEEAFEIEYYSSREWKASQSLPVDSQIAAFDSKIARLREAMLFMRVSRWHEKRGVDLKSPRATLDWPNSWHLGEEPINGIS